MGQKLVFFLLCFSIFTNACDAKILIITHAYNRPDFIALQCQTFQKFLLDEYEFVVFNDAPSSPMQDEIIQVCAEYNIRCFAVPQEMQADAFGPSERHCNGIKYSLETLGFHHDGIVAFFDSDLFLVRPLSIEELMSGFDIVSAYRLGVWGEGTHLKYLWPGLCFMRMNSLSNKESLDFRNGQIDGYTVDTGGYTYHYIQANQPRIKFLDQFPFRFFNIEEDCNALESYVLYTGAEFAYGRHFLHFGAASFGDYPPRSEAVSDFISAVLQP